MFFEENISPKAESCCVLNLVKYFDLKVSEFAGITN